MVARRAYWVEMTICWISNGRFETSSEEIRRECLKRSRKWRKMSIFGGIEDRYEGAAVSFLRIDGRGGQRRDERI